MGPPCPPLDPPLHTTYNPGTEPTLPELLRFTCIDGRVVSVPVEIATKYVQFGTLLLDDQNGSKVKIIAHKNHYDAEQINTEILQEWLTRRGKNPMTWTTLVEVLRDIEAVKCPGRPTPISPPLHDLHLTSCYFLLRSLSVFFFMSLGHVISTTLNLCVESDIVQLLACLLSGELFP